MKVTCPIRQSLRRVKAVIHARGQPQGDEPPVAVRIDQPGLAEQVQKRVGSALDLKQLGIGDRAERADDGVARTGHDRGVRVGRTQAGLKFAGKTIMQAFERRLARLRQVEIGKQPPAADRQVADQGVLDLAEPPHEAGQRRPRDAIGQEKVQIFLL